MFSDAVNGFTGVAPMGGVVKAPVAMMPVAVGLAG